jgi:hypothetical protein
MCSYSGYHGTFNVSQYCHAMKSGIWSPSHACALNEKTMGGTKPFFLNYLKYLVFCCLGVLQTIEMAYF